jgi:hypothetical protein
MAVRFAIKSKYFSLYKALREEAEKVGWVYNDKFTPFIEGRTEHCNCLFFTTEWEFNGWEPKFALSNSSGKVFNIPEQWDEAIEYLTEAYRNNIPKVEGKPKLEISLKNLADHHGVEVSDIIITA